MTSPSRPCGMRRNSTRRTRNLLNPADVVAIDFPGVTGVKRRPTVVVSSAIYHTSRPDVIVGLITSQAVAAGPTDYTLQDWAQAGLRLPSVFRSFFATLPPATHPVLVGHLSDRDWQGVCACVRIALAPMAVSVASPVTPPRNVPFQRQRDCRTRRSRRRRKARRA